MRGDALDLPLEAKLAVDEGDIVELVESESDCEGGMPGQEVCEMGAKATGMLSVMGWCRAGRTGRWISRVSWASWSELDAVRIWMEVQTSRRLQGRRAMSRGAWHHGGNPDKRLKHIR